MKSIIASILLLFSLSSYAALPPNEYIVTNGYGYESHPSAPGSFSCHNDKCVMGAGVYTFLAPESNSTDNEDYFYLPTDMVDYDGSKIYTGVYRDMSGGGPFRVLKDSSFTVTWSTFGAYDTTILFDGDWIDIDGISSGSFIVNYLAGDTFTASISGKANDINAFIEMRITPIIEVGEVPLPPALFMLAPALIGFLGFRRKRS